MALDLSDKTQENQRKENEHIQGEVVQVILPTENTGQKTAFQLRSDFIQIGDNNEIVNMSFESNHRDVVDFLSTGPMSSDKNRTVLRVLRKCAENQAATELRDITESEQIHIRAKIVQIIPSSQAPTVELDVKRLTGTAHIGDGNRLRLPRTTEAQSEDPTDSESDHSCLRIIRKPQSTLLGVGGRHVIELVFTPSTSANIDVEVTCQTLNTRKGVAPSCRWGHGEFRPEEGYAKFWFSFKRPEAKYTLKFSLWGKVLTETAEGDVEVEREILGTASISLETGPTKTQSRAVGTKINNCPSSKKRNSRMKADQNIPSPDPFPPKDVVYLRERFENIMQVLLPLRDDGEWRKLDDAASTLLREHSDANTRAAVLLEQAVAASFRNQNKRAEEIFRKAWRSVVASSNAVLPLLKARAFCYLAGIRRREEKLADAEKLLKDSRQILEGSDYLLDLALLTYEEGSLQLCFMESSSFALKQSIFNKAKEQFDECLELRERMKAREQHIYSMKIQFAVMKKAMLLLNSSTRRFRDKFADESSIKEAASYLDSIREMMRLKNAQAQYCLVRADQFLRQHCFEAAENVSLEAWDLSHAFGFDTIEIAREQLSYIRKIRSQPSAQRES